jgi:hypothetical protein
MREESSGVPTQEYPCHLLASRVLRFAHKKWADHEPNRIYLCTIARSNYLTIHLSCGEGAGFVTILLAISGS